MVRRATVGSVLALCLAGCAPRVSQGNVRPDDRAAEAERPRYTARPDPAAQTSLEKVRAAEGSKSKTQAAESYLAVRKAYPETIAAQDALYRAGVLFFEAGDFVQARKTFNELIYENPLHERANDARLKLGLAAIEVHAYRDAYQTLLSVSEKGGGPERRTALEGAQKAAEGGELFGEALRIALKLADEAPDEPARRQQLQRVEELIEGKVGFQDLAKLRQELPPNHPVWPLLSFKLARVYYHLRDWPRVEETLQAFLREAPQSPYAVEAREMLDRSTRRAEVKPRVVGVILPMSGRFKQWGDAVMRGVTLAFKGSDVEVVVKDSQGDVNLAGKQVEELALDEGAIAIIGPVLQDDSRRAALVAEELQIPILTLTKSDDITAIGGHVFQNMLTNAQQATALADYAVGTLGYKSFAVLYPNIPFGVEVANTFWDQVVAQGGAVRGAENYDHDQTTFTAEAKKLVGRYYLDDRADFHERIRELNEQGTKDAFRRRKALEKARSQVEPVVDFEALLIPDSWSRVGLVAPALAVEDIITNACDPKDLEKIRKTTGKKELRTVTLLGTNTWSSPKGRSGMPELIERANKFVQCSVYVDGFFADSARPATKRFVKLYGDAYRDQQPTLLDAIGYDSAGMIRQVLEKARPKTRSDLTVQLAALKGFEGATGRTAFNEQRQAEKPLFFLTIDKDGVKELTVKATPGKPGT